MWIKKDLDVRDMGSCSRMIGPDFWVFLTIKLVTPCNCSLPQLQDVCGCRHNSKLDLDDICRVSDGEPTANKHFGFQHLGCTSLKRSAEPELLTISHSVTYWNLWLLSDRSCWIKVLLSSSWLQPNYILGFLGGAKVHCCKEGRTKQVLCNRKEWIILCLLSCFHNCWKPNL